MNSKPFRKSIGVVSESVQLFAGPFLSLPGLWKPFSQSIQIPLSRWSRTQALNSFAFQTTVIWFFSSVASVSSMQQLYNRLVFYEETTAVIAQLFLPSLSVESLSLQVLSHSRWITDTSQLRCAYHWNRSIGSEASPFSKHWLKYVPPFTTMVLIKSHPKLRYLAIQRRLRFFYW